MLSENYCSVYDCVTNKEAVDCVRMAATITHTRRAISHAGRRPVQPARGQINHINQLHDSCHIARHGATPAPSAAATGAATTGWLGVTAKTAEKASQTGNHIDFQ